METLDQGEWSQVMSTKGNAPGSNRQKTFDPSCVSFGEERTYNLNLAVTPIT